MEKDIIGAILKKRIKEQGYTQEEFAEKTGVKLGTLKKYMSGENAYNYEMLMIFAKELNCSYEYLLGQSKCANREHEEIREKIHLSDKAIERMIEKTRKEKLEESQGNYMKTLEVMIENDNIIDAITMYLVTNKTTSNMFNDLFETMGIEDFKLPFTNDFFALMSVVNELKDIKYQVTGDVITEYNNDNNEEILEQLVKELSQFRKSDS